MRSGEHRKPEPRAAEGGYEAVQYLVGNATEAGEARYFNPPVGQPVPPAQPSMPNPCKGVPRNPLCR
jgi:hypothetical protein